MSVNEIPVTGLENKSGGKAPAPAAAAAAAPPAGGAAAVATATAPAPTAAEIAAKRALLDRLSAKFKEVIASADPEGTKAVFEYVDFILKGVRPAFEEDGEKVQAEMRQTSALLYSENKDVKSWLKTTPARQPPPAADNLGPTEQAFFITGMLIGLDVDGGLHLAVHLYQLMQAGITVSKLKNTLRTAQVYCGLPAYTASLRTLQTVIRITEKPQHQGKSPEAMVDVILKEFRDTY